MVSVIFSKYEEGFMESTISQQSADEGSSTSYNMNIIFIEKIINKASILFIDMFVSLYLIETSNYNIKPGYGNQC